MKKVAKKRGDIEGMNSSVSDCLATTVMGCDEGTPHRSKPRPKADMAFFAPNSTQPSLDIQLQGNDSSGVFQDAKGELDNQTFGWTQVKSKGGKSPGWGAKIQAFG